MIEEGKFARKCDATGEGMNEGYCVGDGIAYFKNESDLVKYLRDSESDEQKELSDEFILKEAYDLDEYYFTEWEELDDDHYFTADGTEVSTEEVRNIKHLYETDKL